MRERINRLAKGIVDTDFPRLVLEKTEIDEIIKANTRTKRELYVASENSLNIKGLVYSSNPRVRIPNHAFGGLRNHVAYEVDATYRKNGDVISGCFYLVTNAGETKLPFTFRVDLAASGKTLGDFLTAADFAELARLDVDTALRLMEYQDFVEAPFMQDLTVRAIYDSLRGHGNRQSALEEFLVALKVKEPLLFSIEQTEKRYRNPSEKLGDQLVLRKNTWGYAYMEVRSDSSFIQLSKKMITESDFMEDTANLAYWILPERLHGGKNYGRIQLTTPVSSIEAEIIVFCGQGKGQTDRLNIQKHFYRYCRHRLNYECGTCERALLINKMQGELSAMQALADGGEYSWLPLLHAELCLLKGKKDQAISLLNEAAQEVLDCRQQEKTRYCFYQYLKLLATGGDEEQRRAFVRLVSRYAQEEPRDAVLLKLWLQLDPTLLDNPGILLNKYKQCFLNGCRSPLLYLEAYRLYEREPELLRNLEHFEIRVLLSGLKLGLTDEKLSAAVAALAGGARHFHHLAYELLTGLYKKSGSQELLTAICCLLIKGDVRDSRMFTWYELGVEVKISLTRLYDYFLYSLPADYGRLLPKEIFLYFSYEHNLDNYSKSVLYMNLLEFMDKEDPLFQAYIRDMEKFTMEQLFSSRIDRRLASIYRHMLYKDLIDLPMAKVLPAILKSNRITCDDKAMKYVVVCHQELMAEDVYPLKAGEAYVPLYSNHDIILFQDGFGNRYTDAVFSREPVWEEKELLKQCFEVFPDHPMLCLIVCREIMDKQELTREDVPVLERAMEELPLHPLFGRRLLARVIAYYRQMAAKGEDGFRGADISYLICLDKKGLEQEERVSVCETFISQNYFSEAYEMIREYGAEGLSPKRLAKLCAKMVLQNLFDEDELLLQLSYQVFASDFGDSVLLDYLCEHYNGATDQMYQILTRGIRDHVETYDLEERLLAQMLFTGNDLKMDQVFELYATRKKTMESIVKAYFTVKCIRYFQGGDVPPDKVFEYLEGAVNTSVEKDKIPDIYLLALSKFYSVQSGLGEEQSKLCQLIVDILVEAGMVFGYFKDLARFVRIPGDIMDKEIIEYHGSKDRKPYLKVRILPGEKEFHSEEMRQVYKGIYCREKVLFEGEVMEYQVFEEEGGSQVQKDEGRIVCSSPEENKRTAKTRFACLNEMSFAMTVKEEELLKEKMAEYLVKDHLVKACFPID